MGTTNLDRANLDLVSTARLPSGRQVQPPPMLFTRYAHSLFLGDMYRGCAAFLVCSGPSLRSHDLSLLAERGILTCAVNNAGSLIRPKLWAVLDNPGNFCDAIWRDPGIMKFVPLRIMEMPIRVRNEKDEIEESSELVGDMPAVFAFRQNMMFKADEWLYEGTFNCGNAGSETDDLGNAGSRSVMLIALRLLFYLGVRRLYLLGCDFRMSYGKQNYAFPQERTRRSVRGNNRTYRVLSERLRQLKPHFDAEDFRVFNCTPNSELTVFPHVDFEEAIATATENMPERIVTDGMYDWRPNPEQAVGEAKG